MLKKFFRLFMMIMLVSFPNVTDAEISIINDQAQVLTKEEVVRLNEIIQKIEQNYEIKIGVILVKTVANDDMISFANNFLNQNLTENINGNIVLLIDTNQRKCEIAIDSKMRDNTDETFIIDMKNSIQSLLSNGEYNNAITEFIYNVTEMRPVHKISHQDVETTQRDSDAEQNEAFLILSFCVGLPFLIIIRIVMIHRMTNVRKAVGAINYLQKDTVNFYIKDDTFVRTYTERRQKHTNQK